MSELTPVAGAGTQPQGSGVGIGVKVLLIVAAGMTLFFTIVTVIQISLAADERRALFEDRTRQFVQAQADAVMAAVWNVDDAVINQQLQGLERDPELLASRIVDPAGKVLNRHGRGEAAGAIVVSAPIVREKETLGRLELSFSSAGLERALKADLLRAVLSSVAMLLVVLGIVFAGLRVILRQLERIRAAMTALARGDLGVAIPARERRDEIGDMARAIDVFKQTAVQADELHRRERARAETEAQRARTVAAAIQSFDLKVGETLKAAERVTVTLDQTAQSMAGYAEATTERALAVVAAADQAFDNVSQVASATEELTASVAEINQQVTQSASISHSAAADAARADAMVQGLADAASQIGDVVKLISGIAAQTNLLALNATIEAARAGDAGRGFGVVASEVKNLANQTAQATDRISAQVQTVQQATSEAVTVIARIAGVIGQINQISGAISNAIDGQGAAIREIARNAGEAATGTREVAGHIKNVGAAADQNRAAAGEVLSASSAVGQGLGNLRHDVTNFLEIFRAG